MARQKITTGVGPLAYAGEVDDGEAHEGIEDPTFPKLVDPSPHLGDARDKSPILAADAVLPPKPKRYRVTRGGYILTPSGYRTILREGKELSDGLYDIERLKKQGIQLVEID